MNKKVRVILFALFVLLFNGILLLINSGELFPYPTPKGWIVSYCFIHLAAALFFLLPCLPAAGIREIKDRVLNTVLLAYFILAFLLGILTRNDGFLRSRYHFVQPLICHLMLLGLCIGILAIIAAKNVKTAEETAADKRGVAFTHLAASRLRLIAVKCPDAETRATLERIGDLLHASPAQSQPAALSIEKELLDTIGQLETAVDRKDAASTEQLTSKVAFLIEERGMTLRMHS